MHKQAVTAGLGALKRFLSGGLLCETEFILGGLIPFLKLSKLSSAPTRPVLCLRLKGPAVTDDFRIGGSDPVCLKTTALGSVRGCDTCGNRKLLDSFLRSDDGIRNRLPRASVPAWMVWGRESSHL